MRQLNRDVNERELYKCERALMRVVLHFAVLWVISFPITGTTAEATRKTSERGHEHEKKARSLSVFDRLTAGSKTTNW